ncbi:acyl carrier protein [Mucilaginibacter sp. dw_454]|uniref:acyl carrier protein n=1 Tax=Mucilaginibacter sp. dw_454 TaxID=2720079 RepID=UPI001BD4E79C|nr:acyl carrier protein [Mucilaginibacter sp. dw_454]
MDQNEILATITDVFRDALDDEKIILARETTAADVDNWDSLTHFQLVVAVERKFSIRFNSQEFLRWKNVGEMVDSISAKLNP